MDKIIPRRRGQRRFWVTLDGRFKLYYWPHSICVKCPKCSERANFSPAVRDCYRDEGADGIRLSQLPVGGMKEGTGSCNACGKTFGTIDWPTDAYYISAERGGEYWAWNEEFLHVLRARVAGNRVLERHLCTRHVSYHYFLSRLPKHIVLKRNRYRILRQIDRWLDDGGRH
jgi:hypothetical protein